MYLLSASEFYLRSSFCFCLAVLASPSVFFCVLSSLEFIWNNKPNRMQRKLCCYFCGKNIFILFFHSFEGSPLSRAVFFVVLFLFCVHREQSKQRTYNQTAMKKENKSFSRPQQTEPSIITWNVYNIPLRSITTNREEKSMTLAGFARLLVCLFACMYLCVFEYFVSSIQPAKMVMRVIFKHFVCFSGIWRLLQYDKMKRLWYVFSFPFSNPYAAFSPFLYVRSQQIYT